MASTLVSAVQPASALSADSSLALGSKYEADWPVTADQIGYSHLGCKAMPQHTGQSIL